MMIPKWNIDGARSLWRCDVRTPIAIEFLGLLLFGLIIQAKFTCGVPITDVEVSRRRKQSNFLINVCCQVDMAIEHLRAMVEYRKELQEGVFVFVVPCSFYSQPLPVPYISSESLLA
jgi:hypothetical protein